jgi:NADPH-dependent ferric siderophore reductase
MTFPVRGRGAARTALATRVRLVADVTAHMREIELTGPGLPRLTCRPGAHVVVHVPAATGVARRVYSVWRFTPRTSGLVLRVAVHAGDAPACVWARAVRPGDPVTIEPPRRKISPDPAAAFHVFAGDETAAVPLLAMRAAVGPSAPVFGVFESAGPTGEMPDFPGAEPLPWVHRGRASAVSSPVLVRAVQDLELPPGRGVAYLAGESGTCRLLQRHFIEQRRWPRAAVLTQPHWAPGRPGFGAGPDR